MEKTVLFIITYCAVLTVGIQDTPQYILTVPSTLWGGEKFKYCVMSVGASNSSSGDEIVFSFDMLNKDINKSMSLGEKTLPIGKFSHCFEMKAPKQAGFFSLNVSQYRKIKLPGIDSLATLEKEYKSDIRVLKSSGREITLIQTDRPMYKPGQTVKFRIMKLDKDFRPILDPIPLVVVENPAGVRVMQWRNEECKNGMASFEMLLSKEPPMGLWTIKATFDSVVKQTFEVKAYILPKFEVTITPPSYLLPSSQTIDAEVCAKYTYGQPVKGTAEIQVCFKSTYYGFYSRAQPMRPCANHLMEINGCQKFSINTSEILWNIPGYSRSGNLHINATVIEEGTGVILRGNSVGPDMSFTPFKIEMEDDTDNYYKGIFPYRGRAIATKPDGSPAVGELIEIDAKEVTSRSAWGVRKNFTTDNDGKVSFAIENIPENVTGFSIYARAPAYARDYSQPSANSFYQPTSSHFVRRWYSPSNSYIQIEDIPEPVKCGENLNLNVLYSTPPDTRYRFHIMVMSGYEVVYTSHHTHHFKIHDAVDFDKVNKVNYLEEYTPLPFWQPEPPLPPIVVENNATLEANDTDMSEPKPEPQPVDEEIIVPETLLPLSRPERRKRNAGKCVDFNGNEVKYGESFKPDFDNPCKSCVCEKGRKGKCFTAMCMPPCTRYELIPGKCCGFKCLDDEPAPEEVQSPPPPPGNCVDFNGNEVKDGESFKPDFDSPCKSCVCEKGRKGKCFTAMCMPPCTRYELIPGECCGFKCLDDEPAPEEVQSPPPPPANCVDFKGNEVKDGQLYTPRIEEPCESCFCENGKKGRCSIASCMAPSCKRYEMIPGECCGFKCLDDEPAPGEMQSPPPPPVTCTDNLGSVYPEAEVFTPNKSQPCNQCVCVNGKPFGCNMVYCDEPPCPFYELIEGTCCGFECLPIPEPSRSPPIMSTHIARVRLDIPISAMMAPDARILLYYIKEDEETVATSQNLVIEKCLRNKVEMKFSHASVKPGSQTTLNIKAANGSLCSVAVVDKSIDLLKADHRLTKEKLYNKVNRGWGYRPWFNFNDYCKNKVRYSGTTGPLKRYYVPSFDRNIVDALEAFSSANMLVFSNVKIETRPCIKRDRFTAYDVYESQPMPLAREGPLPVAASLEPTSPKKPRSFFPETWLWDLETVDDVGELTIKKNVPDTITEWIGNSVCLSSEDGIGISPVTSITAFQPFFLSFTLPYSAVRGEIVPVVITVFNYMSQCLVMKITLEPSNDFNLENSQTPRLQTVCICGGNSKSIKYYIIPSSLGKMNITASAESIRDDGTCGNNVVSVEGTGISDAVTRNLVIKAEGIPKDYTYSSYICPSESEGMIASDNIELPLPLNTVKDSARGIINVIGDVMGPALANLQDLVRMPYGCGEQNAASFSPNVFVLQYFNKTNQVIGSIEKEAKNNMRVGYQRQLRYRHSDGSYSAWGGESGRSGSMWLTAFVVKCFGQARKFIDIDDKDLKTSISWFRRRQLENGCFPKVGYTHSYYLKGGFAERSNDALMTAFVMIAMLEAGVPRDDPAVLNAVRCLDVQKIEDTYTLTVLSYAYTLFDVSHSRRQEVMDMLELKAQKKDGMMYWERQKDDNEATSSPNTYYRAPSAEVEMTAYALLAFVVGDEDGVAINARPIVLWLSKQRNANGGFSSTQDTIIALQALSIYASLVYQGGIDLTVNINGDKVAKSFGISNQNNLVLQTSPFDVIPNNLSLNVRGVGCALVQAEVKYNIPDESANLLTFLIKVGVFRSKISPNDCKRRSISICVKYVGPGGLSNMAIVDVNMQTGWIPDKTSLKTLLKTSRNKSLGLERYETDGKVVHFYFDKLDDLNRCFYFDVEQTIKVTDPKPAFIEVYDYYETDMRQSTEYDIRTTCGTKLELPVLTVEEYLEKIRNTPPDRITQIRVPIGAIDTIRQPAASRVTCPVCKQNMSVKGSEFDNLVCKSANIYKVRFTGSSRKYTMKIYADLKPRKKDSIKLFANHVMADKCNCSSLVKGKKLMIFTNRDVYERADQEITLNDLSTVVNWSRKFEKAVFRKNKRC